ncbi:MAG: hypothetical protein V5A55_03515 [Halovenus sp.]
MDRRLRHLLSVLVGVLALHYLLGSRLWRLRLVATRLLSRLPNRLLPTPLKVLPPPSGECVGVWSVPPDRARNRLNGEFGFTQLFRAYLHAYERDGVTIYEVSSCAYRPEGVTGKWQLHVRLFPTHDGGTEVWAHWELNPNVSPIAHLRREGYDPVRGERELRALLPEGTLE